VILFGFVCWLLNGRPRVVLVETRKGPFFILYLATVLDLFRRRVDWLSWVIQIRRLLPLFGDGCGTVLGHK